MRKTILAAVMAVLAGTTAWATIDKVSEVEVTADLGAVQNEKAAAYWANLATDLQTAIATRVADRAVPADARGARISVDIREVELANSFERTFNIADAVLVGQVLVKNPEDGSQDQAYQLSVSLQGAAVDASGQPVVFTTLDTPEAYSALVNRFASEVVERLN